MNSINVQQLSKVIFVLFCILAAVKGTEVRRCTGDKPFPLDVRVHGCDASPCDVIKGETAIFEIDFVSYKYITSATTLVKATTLGITIPYELPEDVRDVCPNLMFDAYCPLYPTEDVTYQFVFPIGNYPEIGVKIETYIVDQDKDITTCFLCDIKVKKGNGGRTDGKTIYQLDWKV